MKFHSPLKWPSGWGKTLSPHGKAPYTVSGIAAMRDLEKNLKLLLGHDGFRTARISANIPVSGDGRFYSEDLQRRNPPSGGAGVAVHWTRKGVEQTIACDKYLAIGNNIRALGLSIEAIRAIERAGATQVLERVFTGFAALPAGGPTVAGQVEAPKPRRLWWQVFGWPADPLDGTPLPIVSVSVEAMFKSLSKQRHPDVPGGSHEAFLELQGAVEDARAALALLGFTAEKQP